MVPLSLSDIRPAYTMVVVPVLCVVCAKCLHITTPMSSRVKQDVGNIFLYGGAIVIFLVLVLEPDSFIQTFFLHGIDFNFNSILKSFYVRTEYLGTHF